MNSTCDAELLPPYIFEGKRNYKNLLRHCPIFPSAAIVDIQKFPEKIFFNEKLKVLRDDYAYWLDVVKTCGIAYGNQKELARYRLLKNSTITAARNFLQRKNIANGLKLIPKIQLSLSVRR